MYATYQSQNCYKYICTIFELCFFSLQQKDLSHGAGKFSVSQSELQS
jgi:hypothetical protein